MNEIPRALRNRNGSTLIVVMGLTLLGTLAASSVMFSIGSRIRQASKQVDLEQAFYLAAAGAERAASRVAAGNDTSTTLTASLGNGGFVTDIDCQPGAGGEVQIDVTSVGTVDGVSRTITMHGLRRVSWARYSLWYDSEAVTLNMFPGERFDGRVYSRPQLRFEDDGLSGGLPQVRFTDKVWSVQSSIWKASSAVNPVFEQGLNLNAPRESMASVDFSALLATAKAGGLVLEGPTTISINNTTMTITNSRKGWTNQAQPIPANGVVYVKTATSGTSPTGDLTVSAPNGLGGRLTMVSDNDIKITNHLVYKNNPTNNPSSTDALGLIAKRNMAVQTTAPKNLQIYAHIICQTGGFGVVNYTTRTGCGTLTLFGGLVNNVRNAVNQNGGGASGGTGYTKNYIFDKRFSKNPPPSYPVLTDELEWTAWEG